jgi:hypothetical protein
LLASFYLGQSWQPTTAPCPQNAPPGRAELRSAGSPPPAFAANDSAAAAAAPLRAPPRAVDPPSWGIAAATAAHFDPFPGISAALGWRNYSARDALHCAQRLGGLAFVGDSHMRTAVNHLMAMLGRAPLPLNKPGAFADVVEAFEVAGSGAATTHVAFRFAPSLLRAADAVEDLLLGRRGGGGGGDGGGGGGAAPRFRALAVASAHWDILGEGWAYKEGCAPHCRAAPPPQAHFLQLYGARLAHLLRRVRALAPALPPLTLLWRTATSTREQAGGATLARFSAANALAKRALGAWNARAAGSGMPPWRVLDSDDLLPPRLVGGARFIAADGFHPSPAAAAALLQGMLNELCGAPWETAGVEALADALGDDFSV